MLKTIKVTLFENDCIVYVPSTGKVDRDKKSNNDTKKFYINTVKRRTDFEECYVIVKTKQTKDKLRDCKGCLFH